VYKIRRLGIIYNPTIERAKSLAHELSAMLRSQKEEVWLFASLDDAESAERIKGAELVVSIGGDGTILRVARIAAPAGVPILGINMGRLGFMTELQGKEAMEKMPIFLNGEGWVEERAMLEVVCRVRPGADPMEPQYALNEIVVSRGTVARVIYIETTIDGAYFTTYKADGLLVSTATGSTAYSLAAGGPVLHPQSRDILLMPLSPHLTFDKALVLPPHSFIQLKIGTDHQAVISIDGQVNVPFEGGDEVQVRLSPFGVKFLRAQPHTYFYATLTNRLQRQN